MKHFKGSSFAKVYSMALDSVFNDPEYITKPRNMNIHESLNVSLEITNPYLNLFLNKSRSIPSKYLANELYLYLLGINSAKEFISASPFWKNIANDDGTVNSAYGYLIFKEENKFENTQFEWALNSLLNDKDSRQAIIHFNQPNHQSHKFKDFVCTVYGIFHIRNDRLDFTINMRSNDMVLGTTFDIPFFTVLHQLMLQVLRDKKYPNLTLGTYIHNVNSLHIYERDFDTIKKMLDYEFYPDSLPILTSEDKEQISNATLDRSIYQIGEFSLKQDSNLINWILENK